MVQDTQPPQIIEVDCSGMQCPAPILQISKTWRAHRDEAVLIQVTATDGDFPRDLEAWCRTTKTELLSMNDHDGSFVAVLGLNGARATDPASQALVSGVRPALAAAAAAAPSTASISKGEGIQELDCRGLQCPAPILRISKTWRACDGKPTLLAVEATDGDFPRDLQAWCRTTKSELLDMTVLPDGAHRALLGLFGATADTVSAPAPVAEDESGRRTDPGITTRAPAPAPTSSGPVELDLRGQPAALAVLRIGQAVLQAGGQPVSIVAKAGTLESQLYAWAAATGAQVGALQVDGGEVRTTVRLEGLPAEAVPAAPAPVAQAPAAAAAPAAETSTAMVLLDDNSPPREDLATLLVLHNDMESLLAAMMVANTARAQGMEVLIFFSFWGVNLLRGEEPQQELQSEGVGWMQRMMKWMMPKGPDRQGLAKMNMGGAGSAMMKHLMRQRNVQSLREMMADAVEQDVKFVMCTMSMGIMGIEKRDVMDLPNLEYGGVTSFVESSRRSALSLVF